jgi:hypothetical protein
MGRRGTNESPGWPEISANEEREIIAADLFSKN